MRRPSLPLDSDMARCGHGQTQLTLAVAGDIHADSGHHRRRDFSLFGPYGHKVDRVEHFEHIDLDWSPRASHASWYSIPLPGCYAVPTSAIRRETSAQCLMPGGLKPQMPSEFVGIQPGHLAAEPACLRDHGVMVWLSCSQY